MASSGELPIVKFSTDEPSPVKALQNCHVAWLESNEIISELPYTSLKEKHDFFSKELEGIKKCKWVEKGSADDIAPSRAINLRCTEAAYLAHISNFGEALKRISDVEKYVETIKFQRPEHHQAYKFLVQANKYCINIMMKQQNFEGGVGEEMEGIISLYDEASNGFLAVLSMAKGRLAIELLCREEQIQYFREATKLDPHFSEWHLMLFRALRSKRRELREIILTFPTDEEEEAMQTAYRLDSQSHLNQTCMAQMMEERYRKEPDSDEKRNAANEIVRLFRNAMEGTTVKKWIKIQLAEMHGFGNYPHMDPEEGERLFAECEEEYPHSSHVLHKFGKYYSKQGNYENASEYFLRALTFDPINFPCLTDWAQSLRKLIWNRGERQQRILSVLEEKCIPVKMFYHKKPFTDLMLTYGVLLWNKYDAKSKRKACEAWIEACLKTSGNCIIVGKSIKAQFITSLGKFNIKVQEVIDSLEILLALEESSENWDDKRNQVMRDLISELTENSEQTGMPLIARRVSSSTATTEADSNWRLGSSSQDSSSGIFSGYVPCPPERFASHLDRSYEPTRGHKMRNSLADNDNNWRA